MHNTSYKQTTVACAEDAASIINLSRYPLADSNGSEFDAFARQCRSAFMRQGYVALHGFLEPDVSKALTQHASELLASGRRIDYGRTAYCVSEENLTSPSSASNSEAGSETGDNDPQNLLLSRGLWLLSGKLFSRQSRLRSLYESKPLLTLYERIAGYPIYPLSENEAQVNIVAQGDGDANNWHFDPDLDMTATLMLQGAEAGGKFELVDGLNDPEGADRDYFRDILTGQSNRGIVQVPQHAGTLLIFNSRTSLHRVTQVKGAQTRFLVVFSYSNQPDVCLNSAITASSY